MTEQPGERANTKVSRIIKAPRMAVYQACIDPGALASWRAPDMRRRLTHCSTMSRCAFRMLLETPVRIP
jgi:uncharacterized protein YndB with AHSA1/START domain